ncbi:MAG: VTT domain-containing protein [Proteobacteria bacterium]|nr:VTT domain-containing protein [Pseudomonadota bacterium]MBU1544714.1 VTT domain-containing protein [Pseudomonadota bacterium]MBU2431159.1 VTT domain-containing protein [Pseudomonadota bacterium]MBU2481867.1 VTT domain-containing protein [Pseudomonadota bacterium]
MKSKNKINSHGLKKSGLVVVVAGLVALFFISGLQDYLTLDFIKSSQAQFQEIYSQNPAMVIAIFVGFYILVIALNLPGAVVLGLAAGALFGAVTGTIIISFASSIGATLACLLSRYLLRDWVQKKFGTRLARVNEGIRREGAFYLFSMRLIPVIPFFIINLVMGLTPIRLWTFYWVSQIGMLPGTAIFVNAGSQIAQIDSLSGIVSGQIIFSLALLGIFPLVTKKLLTAYRKRYEKAEAAASCGINMDRLSPQMDHIQETCTNCGACVNTCAFLSRYGTPKQIIESHDFSNPETARLAFECSLCDLCSTVCPEKLDPCALFLSIRREAVSGNIIDLAPYKSILGYEKRGLSQRYSYYALPEGCDTIFFPGCTLPGTRPETTFALFEFLKSHVPELGLVMDCCTKPSHDLGRGTYFNDMFGEMLAFLVKSGIKRVWVACPNCHKIFSQYGGGLKIETIYEVLSRGKLPEGASGKGTVVIHDPCPMRNEFAVQESVRTLLGRMGMTVESIQNQKKKTLCCGEGGSVGFVNPGLARAWGICRKEQAKGRTIATYCAGCAGFLNRVTPTVHIADLLFGSDKNSDGSPKVARAPFTYLNRLKLKKRFKKSIIPAISRVRPYTPEAQAQLETDECTLEDCTVRLKQKGLALAVVFLISIGLFFLVQHFMYLLDSYLYTAEFHAMLIKNNLLESNVQIFKEYFKALGPAGTMLTLMAGTVFNTLNGFWPRPILHIGVNQAFGTGLGGLISLVAFLAAGLIFYGMGRFFLGEILPLTRKTKAPLSRAVAPILGLLMIIPHIPLAFPAVLAAFTRVRFRTLCLVLLAALLIRTGILMVLPIQTIQV